MTNTRTAYALARLADVQSPDSPTSAGAEWLIGIADSYQDDLANATAGHGDLQDAIAELADSAVPTYTHNRWQVFVDLCAYEEDISEYGTESQDMTERAGVALYIIAERLLIALVDA